MLGWLKGEVRIACEGRRRNAREGEDDVDVDAVLLSSLSLHELRSGKKGFANRKQD